MGRFVEEPTLPNFTALLNSADLAFIKATELNRSENRLLLEGFGRIILKAKTKLPVTIPNQHSVERIGDGLTILDGECKPVIILGDSGLSYRGEQIPLEEVILNIYGPDLSALLNDLGVYKVNIDKERLPWPIGIVLTQNAGTIQSVSEDCEAIESIGNSMFLLEDEDFSYYLDVEYETGFVDDNEICIPHFMLIEKSAKAIKQYRLDYTVLRKEWSFTHH